MLNKYIGDKKFYKMVMAIAIPIMIQNGITQFVNMLDNIMIGRVGTVEMTGVAIANQLIFVFNLCVFGALSGAGIFGAQYYGKNDHEGVRNTFRFKCISVLILVVVGTGIFLGFGENLISLYLKGEGSPENAEAALNFGFSYMKIILIGFIPYVFSQVYSSTLRETGETVLPMVSGIVAVFVNLVFNYILIFGNFGAPKLGVEGAAIATVISRFIELGVIMFFTHKRKHKYLFVNGLYKTMRVPAPLVRQIIIRGMPLLLNEGLWAGGMAMLNQCYSLRGQDIIAATNISVTLWNVFSVAFMSMGVTVGIIVGHCLGAGDTEGAKDNDRKLIVFSVMVAAVVGVIYASVSGLFPKIYNTTDAVRSLATDFILIGAIFMPFNAFAHASYFTLRAGGKTWVTIIFDSAFVWCVAVPTAYVLSRFTGLPIIPLYACCQALDIIKCVIGFILVKKGIWINNIVDGNKETLLKTQKASE